MTTSFTQQLELWQPKGWVVIAEGTVGEMLEAMHRALVRATPEGRGVSALWGLLRIGAKR